MQTLQNVTPKSKTRQQLTDDLIELLFNGHKTFTEACKQLCISRPRGYRLWERWKQTEEARLVDTEWWDLYLTVKQENPEKALECLTRLKHKMIVEKTEVKQTVKQISIKWDMPNEPNPPSTVQTTPETIRIPQVESTV